MSERAARRYRRSAEFMYRRYSEALAALSRVKPLFNLALRVLTHDSRKAKGRVLPLNAPVGRPEQSPLAREVLARLISSSTAIAAMNECMCRAVGGCTDYPRDIGCLVLGSEALRLHPGLGRAVGREEALGIVDRAIACGLVPMVIHLMSDGILWSLDYRRMLTVCFCCPCHCLIRRAAEGGGGARLTGLAGVAVALDQTKCAGCGACASACFTGALSIREGKACIDSDACVACGRCAMACGRGALAVEVQDDFDAGSVAAECGRRTARGSVFKRD